MGFLGFVLAMISVALLGLAPHRHLLLEERIPIESEPSETDPAPIEEGKLVLIRHAGRESRSRRDNFRPVLVHRRVVAAAPRASRTMAAGRAPFDPGAPVSPPLLC